MKAGDRLRIEGVPYSVHSTSGDAVMLVRVRRPISIARFRALLAERRWRRPSVSATFLVDSKTGRTINNMEMLALGIPSKRIEKLHATLLLMPIEVTP